MFVIVSCYRAKVGEEDAIIALHEEWERNQSHRLNDNLSWELLIKDEAPRDFIAILHLPSQDQAQVVANSLNQDAWYSRLVSLIEEDPISINCTTIWQISR